MDVSDHAKLTTMTNITLASLILEFIWSNCTDNKHILFKVGSDQTLGS